MAGGVNPFGFSGGVIPQAVRPPKRGPQNLPSAPFGFAPPPSKMQQTLAILNEYNPLPAFERLLKSPMALGGAISEQDIADGLMVSGAVTGGSAAAPKPRNALNMGIRAYHGSPHDFDEFSMSKIGTGEGAQAYGHGLYFAENEGVARGYRDALTDPQQVKIRINDKEIPSVWNEDLRNTYPELYKGLNAADQDAMDSLLGTMEGSFSMDDAARAADSVGGRAKALFNSRIKPGLTKPEVGPGRMYEVEINADPDAFLDWDKPLSEQPPAMMDMVRDALKREGYLRPNDNGPRQLQAAIKAWRMERGGMADTPMEALLSGNRSLLGGNPGEVSQKLNEAGIPGIKYLDAGSRDKAKGTRNYVVFDDKLVSIVKKYGIAGASAMLGYNILDGMDPAQAEELQRIEGNQ